MMPPMTRTIAIFVFLVAPAALAQSETFHGWSKDGSYLAYQAPGNNDIIELFFCQSDASLPPTWPAGLDGLDRIDDRGLSCVRFIDPNKAPYQWKKALVLPAPATQSNGIAVLSELITDGESPGIVLESGGKRQVCYISALREDSRVQKTWFHPNGHFFAALVDGRFSNCALTVKGGKTPAPVPPVMKHAKPSKRKK